MFKIYGWNARHEFFNIKRISYLFKWSWSAICSSIPYTVKMKFSYAQFGVFFWNWSFFFARVTYFGLLKNYPKIISTNHEEVNFFMRQPILSRANMMGAFCFIHKAIKYMITSKLAGVQLIEFVWLQLKKREKKTPSSHIWLSKERQKPCRLGLLTYFI